MARESEREGRGSEREVGRSSSWSRAVWETVKGSHEYVVKGFSLAKGMGPGRYLASEAFAVGGHQWAIYLYPDGKSSDDNSAYVSLFVALASDASTDVRALFELSLRDQTGRANHKIHSHFRHHHPHRRLRCPYTLKYRGSMWGYKKFFKRSLLDRSHFLRQDRLLIHCTVGVVRARLHTHRRISLPAPPSDLGRNLRELLDSGTASDVAFLVGDEIVRAHKQILAARSPVFRAQFFGPIGNPNLHEVIVQDVEPPIFKAMIQFIYSDELEEEELSVSKIMVQHLLAAADRYGMERLRLVCEAKLCSEITTETAATTLALAERHNCSLLKANCLQFIASRDNLSVVMQTEGFGYLEESCPGLLSDLLATVARADRNPDPDRAAISASSSRKRAALQPHDNNLAVSFGTTDPAEPKCIRRRI